MATKETCSHKKRIQHFRYGTHQHGHRFIVFSWGEGVEEGVDQNGCATSYENTLNRASTSFPGSLSFAPLPVPCRYASTIRDAKERAGNEVDSNGLSVFVPFFQRLGLSHSFFFVSLDVHYSTRHILLKRLQTKPKITNVKRNQSWNDIDIVPSTGKLNLNVAFSFCLRLQSTLFLPFTDPVHFSVH